MIVQKLRATAKTFLHYNHNVPVAAVCHDSQSELVSFVPIHVIPEQEI
jgi:hypothetical protein